MDEQAGTLHHVQTLYRYMRALELGDIETITTLLSAAEQSPGLERMLLEINTLYQYEDHTVVASGDLVAAQHLLLDIADQVTRREEMEIPSLHTNENVAYIQPALVEPMSRNGHIAPKKHAKVAIPVFPATMLATRKWYRSPRSWIVAAVASLLIALLLLPGTSVLANQFLSLFRVQQFQPVQVSNQEISDTLSQYAAPSIDDLGTVQFQAHSLHVQNNLTAHQASLAVGFPLLLPRQLPPGVSNDPSFSVIGSGHGVFTFSAAKVHAYLVKNGHNNVTIPANLDGATFDVTTSAGILVKYGYRAANPFLMIEIPGPLVRAAGKASLQELRDFVLSLPNLPSQLVTQLKQIDLNNGTIPLPIPAGIQTQAVVIHHTSGLLLSSDKPTNIEYLAEFPAGNMLAWQEKGIIYAFGGITIDAKQLLASANSLP